MVKFKYACHYYVLVHGFFVLWKTCNYFLSDAFLPLSCFLTVHASDPTPFSGTLKIFVAFKLILLIITFCFMKVNRFPQSQMVLLLFVFPWLLILSDFSYFVPRAPTLYQNTWGIHFRLQKHCQFISICKVPIRDVFHIFKEFSSSLIESVFYIIYKSEWCKLTINIERLSHRAVAVKWVIRESDDLKPYQQ